MALLILAFLHASFLHVLRRDENTTSWWPQPDSNGPWYPSIHPPASAGKGTFGPERVTIAPPIREERSVGSRGPSFPPPRPRFSREGLPLADPGARGFSRENSRAEAGSGGRRFVATWTTMHVARAPRATVRRCRTRFSGVCFDPSCQAAADRALLVVAAVPLVMVGAAGVFFAGKRDVEEEDELLRDAKGEPVLVASSYENRALPEDAEVHDDVTMLRIPVGRVGRTRLRTYAFAKQRHESDPTNSRKSRVFSVTLPRPLGLVMAEDRSLKRAVVESVDGAGRAGQQLALASLGGSMEAPKPGDVLRAFTCTVVVYKAAALAFGAQKPERTIVMYGADGQPWPRVADALRRGVKADGDVTLVLERFEDETDIP